VSRSAAARGSETPRGPARRGPGPVRRAGRAARAADLVAEGNVDLRQLGWDEDWGFTYADGGHVTFHGTGEDIRAGRWDRIQVLFESS
jgi:hypothetical protein